MIRQMSQRRISSKNKRLAALIMFIIFASFVSYDVYHLIKVAKNTSSLVPMELIEAVILLLGCSAFASLWVLTINEERNEIRFEKEISQMKAERDEWKEHSAQLIRDFQDYILTHFDYWKLTASEKEVGLFLLKGMSFKEIAQIRNVCERTIRNQSLSIYSKSGLTGKHELASYFLEELFQPKVQ